MPFIFPLKEIIYILTNLINIGIIFLTKYPKTVGGRKALNIAK
jgi:hypothetical protein